MKDMTLAQAGRSLVRYAPFLATALAIVLIAVVLPMRRDGDAPQQVRAGAPAAVAPAAGGGLTAPAGGLGPTTTTAPAAGSATGAAPAVGGTPSGGPSTGSGTTGGGTATGGAATTSGAAAAPAPSGDTAVGGETTADQPDGSGALPVSEAEAADANCDPATGRIKLPTPYAPSCRTFDGANTGSDYQGVTGDEIVVAWYRGQPDPALQAILTAAGADDSPEQARATVNAFVDLLQKHLQTYGRTIKIVEVQGSGRSSDDAAAKADALRVATEVKAFASLNSPNNTYVEELVARGVMCFYCTTQLPQQFYDRWAPYVYSTSLPSYEQTLLLAIDLQDKQLRGKAKWAGDPVLQQLDRRYGLVCYNDAQGAYTGGCQFTEEEMKRRGINHVVTVSFTFDLTQAQEQSRTMIAKLKDNQTTTLVLALDPIYPIFLTQEATKQNYFPEWEIVGGALTDTTFFGRTYAKEQWVHAFGSGPLSARAPQETGTSYRLHVWHHGRPPEADDTYSVIWPGPWQLFLGIHMAGETLTPQTMREGLAQYPPSGGAHTGGVVGAGVSYYNTNIWGSNFVDSNAVDDGTLIWWDNTARCRDEIGNDGVGCLRYVDGGLRYFPGSVPAIEPKFFDPNGTVIVYNELPPQDAYAEYEHQPH